IDRPTAKLILRIYMYERAVALRAMGIKDFIVGGVCAALALLLGWGATMAVEAVLPWNRGKLTAILWGPCGLAICYGGFRLLRGLERVVFGAQADGAVSDVDD